MDTIVITPHSQESIPFLKELLSKLSDVKDVKVVLSDDKKKAKVLKDIDSGLKEVKEILNKNKATKSFEQFLNEI